MFKPTRLRLRTMLLAAAVAGLIVFAAREWMLLRDAREQFDFAWAGWSAGRVTEENVVLTSARLMRAEAAAPWISQHKARQLHVERLNRLLADIENPIRDSPPDAIERQANYVRSEIEKLRGSSATKETQ
jgi:hypothetical protein